MEGTRIYIAEQRGETIIEGGWLNNTLNYGEYTSSHREPIGCLRHVNTWTGIPGQSFVLPLPEQSISVFIPLVSALVVYVKGREYTAPLGSLLALPAEKGTDVQIRQSGAGNDHFIFQQFVFSAVSVFKDIRIYALPIADPTNKNRMIPVLEDGCAPFQAYIGAFIGKTDYKLILDPEFNHAFALTLDGHFEVEKCLLFHGDALSLTGLKELDTECLSDTGLLLAFQF